MATYKQLIVNNSDTCFINIYGVLACTPTLFQGVFLGLDSWGVSTSGWGSGLVGLECANAQNSYFDLLGGVSGDESRGCCTKVGAVITPLRGCRKLPALFTIYSAYCLVGTLTWGQPLA